MIPAIDVRKTVGASLVDAHAQGHGWACDCLEDLHKILYGTIEEFGLNPGFTAGVAQYLLSCSIVCYGISGHPQGVSNQDAFVEQVLKKCFDVIVHEYAKQVITETMK